MYIIYTPNILVYCLYYALIYNCIYNIISYIVHELYCIIYVLLLFSFFCCIIVLFLLYYEYYSIMQNIILKYTGKTEYFIPASGTQVFCVYFLPWFLVLCDVRCGRPKVV